MPGRQPGAMVHRFLHPAPGRGREAMTGSGLVLTCTRPLHRLWRLYRGHAALSGNRERLQRKHRETGEWARGSWQSCGTASSVSEPGRGRQRSHDRGMSSTGSECSSRHLHSMHSARTFLYGTDAITACKGTAFPLP